MHVREEMANPAGTFNGQDSFQAKRYLSINMLLMRTDFKEAAIPDKSVYPVVIDGSFYSNNSYLIPLYLFFRFRSLNPQWINKKRYMISRRDIRMVNISAKGWLCSMLLTKLGNRQQKKMHISGSIRVLTMWFTISMRELSSENISVSCSISVSDTGFRK